MVNYFTFGGIKSTDYDIYMSGEGLFNSPEREVEMIDIPGRNGAYVFDRGKFSNIEVSYRVFNHESSLNNFTTKLANYRNAISSLKGYQTLTDTINTGEYRMATLKDGIEIKPIKYNNASEFEIVFNCKPQRFLTGYNETTYATGTHTITNPTKFPAYPLIKTKGSGYFSINGHKVTIASNSISYLYFDTEILEGYYNGTYYNNYFTIANDDLALNSGSNTLVVSGLTSFAMTPRYWRV